MTLRPKAMFAMEPEHIPGLFPPSLLHRLQAVAEIDPGLVADDFTRPEVRAALTDTEVLITGWGCPSITEQVLAEAPRLGAVLHAAGGVKAHITEACWDRGLRITTAAAANALPVAEFSLASILFAGKNVFRMREAFRDDRDRPADALLRELGNFGVHVGIIGASRIGRRVIDLLRPFDFEVTVTDPYLDVAGAKALGARLLPLPELLAESDVVSVHAPNIPETRNMLGVGELSLLHDGATLINTARGALVDTEALTQELKSGRINAVLDVTEPEPLPENSPLWALPNVFLTPHLAGSLGNELERMGASAVREMELFAAGEPAANPVLHADLARLA